MGKLTVKERLALEGIRQIAFVQVAGVRTVVIGGGIELIEINSTDVRLRFTQCVDCLRFGNAFHFMVA